MKTANLIAVTAIALSTTGLTTAQAAHPQNIDDLAYALKRQSTAFVSELRLGFSASPQFRHLYSDAIEMANLADHVHDVAHDRGRILHLKHDVDELDRLFHHVEGLVDELKRQSYRPAQVRRFHNGYEFHAGSRNGNDFHLRRLCAILDQMEETLHDLQDAVDARLLRNSFDYPARPVVIPGASGNGRAIPVIQGGNGRFSVSLVLR